MMMVKVKRETIQEYFLFTDWFENNHTTSGHVACRLAFTVGNGAFLATQLWFRSWDRISHYPLQAENPLSSSPKTHQICHSTWTHWVTCNSFPTGMQFLFNKIPSFTFCLHGEKIRSYAINIQERCIDYYSIVCQHFILSEKRGSSCCFDI